jgi:hypothetical protein
MLSQPAQSRRMAKLIEDDERIETLTVAGQKESAQAQVSTPARFPPWEGQVEGEEQLGGDDEARAGRRRPGHGGDSDDNSVAMASRERERVRGVECLVRFEWTILVSLTEGFDQWAPSGGFICYSANGHSSEPKVQGQVKPSNCIILQLSGKFILAHIYWLFSKLPNCIVFHTNCIKILLSNELVGDGTTD